MPDKAAVRAHATRLALPVAEKPDSQDICFVPAGRYGDLVAKLRPDAAIEGDIVTEMGAVLGRHRGIAHYTVGQSKRLGLPDAGGQRLAVVALDATTRRVIVGPRDRGTTQVRLRAVNWLIDPVPAETACAVRLRARDSLRPATVRATPDGAIVTLAEPALPAPGQACVFYAGTRVLGGGTIRAPN
jgi:tRNA-specific 2-thiouridylase